MATKSRTSPEKILLSLSAQYNPLPCYYQRPEVTHVSKYMHFNGTNSFVNALTCLDRAQCSKYYRHNSTFMVLKFFNFKILLQLFNSKCSIRILKFYSLFFSLSNRSREVWLSPGSHSSSVLWTGVKVGHVFPF